MNIIKSPAGALLTSITSRRALWLKPWVVDAASKTNWCKIPNYGTNLFGSKLDSAISKVTDRKSGLIPSDRRYREAKSYRPGKEFKRN